MERARISEITCEPDAALHIVRLRARRDAGTEHDDVRLGLVGAIDKTTRYDGIREEGGQRGGHEPSQQSRAIRTIVTHRNHALPPDWRASLRSPAKREVSEAAGAVSVASKEAAPCKEDVPLAPAPSKGRGRMLSACADGVRPKERLAE